MSPTRVSYWLDRMSGRSFGCVRRNKPLANKETKSVLETMEATVYEASIRRLKATDAPVVHCLRMCTK